MFIHADPREHYAARQFRWYYWSRNATIFLTVPLLSVLVVLLASSSHVQLGMRVVVAVLFVVSVGAGLSFALLRDLPLRRRVDRMADSGSRPLVFRSARLDTADDTATVTLGEGWIDTHHGDLVVHAFNRGDHNEVWRVAAGEIRKIDSRKVANGAGYSRLEISSMAGQIDVEVPRQHGLSWAGVSNAELSQLISRLRRETRADLP